MPANSDANTNAGRNTPPAIPLLYVTTRMNVGGTTPHILSLMERMPGLGYRTSLAIGHPRPGEGEDVGETDPIRVEHLRRPIHPVHDLRARGELRRVTAQVAPVIVHTHQSKAGILGRRAARRTDVPVVIHTHHGHMFIEGYHPGPSVRALVRIERSVARRTDALIAVSDSVRDELLDLGIGKPQQWHVIDLGMDLDPLLTLGPADRPAARERLGLPHTATVIGVVSRVTEHKDHRALIAAVRPLMARHDDLHLVIAGDGETRATLQRETSDLGSRVRFLGWVGSDDLPELYAALDIAALSSWVEGTPVALIEASAAGLPVVATDVGGVRDVVADGESGWLVSAKDVDALRERVARLVDEPGLARRMGSRGRELVRDRFGLDRMIRSTDAVYREALQRKGVESSEPGASER
jgi:glycosyltransferase involved in cell wall biosynthesis